MTTTTRGTTTRLNEDMVLLTVPERDALEAVARLEGFESVEEWLPFALISHAHWIALREHDEQTATTLALAINAHKRMVA